MKGIITVMAFAVGMGVGLSLALVRRRTLREYDEYDEYDTDNLFEGDEGDVDEFAMEAQEDLFDAEYERLMRHFVAESHEDVLDECWNDPWVERMDEVERADR